MSCTYHTARLPCLLSGREPRLQSLLGRYIARRSRAASHTLDISKIQVSVLVMFADKPVSIHRCFAAVRCSGDGLSISEISHISSRKYSRNVRFSFIMGDNVAFGVEVHLSLEYRSVWFVSDCHEHAVRLETVFLSSLEISTPDPCNIAVSQYLVHDRIPDEFYLRILQGTVLHSLTRS